MFLKSRSDWYSLD